VVVLSMIPDDPFGYGRIVRDADGSFLRIVEQKDCSPEEALVTECNSGFYCFDTAFLFEALGQVSTDNAQGEYYLTDVIEIARNAGRVVEAMPAQDADECLGVNTRVQLAEAAKVLQRRINRAHMLAGVTMLDPDQVWVGPKVSIAQDVELLPQTFLMGDTAIGEDSIIGPNSRLTDTQVGSGCRVEETVAVDAVVEDECACGPRAYLHPGAHLPIGTKTGAHAEVR
jgi:bifunctional UDP-N-acetylglucosamine pyrophosphorylase/glucosamine-1-phosphate N-acetyltransferase